MSADTFDLPALAKYLGRDARELEKLADQGRLPGRRVGGQWLFSKPQIHEWLGEQIPGWSEHELHRVEQSVGSAHEQLLVRRLLTPERIALPLAGRTAGGVLRALVDLANSQWEVYQPAEVLASIREREAYWPTALPGGVAMVHPRRPMSAALADSLLAFGATPSGIPFGDPNGQLTDLFFLVLCQDDRTHLQVLARLARMIQRPGFLDRLRQANTPHDVLEIVEQAELETMPTPSA